MTPASMDRALTPLEELLREKVGRLVGPALTACETEIDRTLASTVPLISELGNHVASAGGKRLRPILLLLCAKLGGPLTPRSARLGCVVELLHTATLIHDDVVDQAPLRRGRPSANARWGDDASILVGDHLYSKSFALLVQDHDRAVMEVLAHATVSMTEAEVFQLERKRAGITTESDYLWIIRKKTASFISACCRIGGIVGGVAPEQVEALGTYGENLGIAFQIVDDSLDFVADEARLGKAIGSDLREGKRTLPLIITMERATPAEQARIQHLLRNPGLGDGAIGELRALVARYDGVGYATTRAIAYAERGKGEIERFPPSEERETLTLLADYVVDRDR